MCDVFLQGSFYDGRMRDGKLQTLAYSGEIEGIPVVLLRPDWQATNLFQGDQIYGGSYNELEAYLFFSRSSFSQAHT
jgi:starch synthase